MASAGAFVGSANNREEVRAWARGLLREPMNSVWMQRTKAHRCKGETKHQCQLHTKISSTYSQAAATALRRAPEYLHPGLGWKLCYASGGILSGLTGSLRAETEARFGDTDEYNSGEPNLAGAHMSSFAMRSGNAELYREADRHGRDYELEELLDRFGSKADMLNRAVSNARLVGYDPIFFSHRLNRLRFGRDLRPGDPDPMGLVVGFTTIPAKDRASTYSTRRSIRKHESFTSFLIGTQTVLAAMEQQTVGEGFCIDLRMPIHNAKTKSLNERACAKLAAELEEAMADEIDEVTEQDNEVGDELVLG